MDRRLTTPDVPAKYLGAVFLTGRIPWRVAPEDPRVSYALHVPPSRYPAKYTAGGDPGDDKKLPLVVWVHGTGRDVEALSTDLKDFAEANGCAVLTPFFPANVDGPNDLDAYKLLRSRTLRADRVLLATLDEVAVYWPGIATDKIYLGGFSGGGQFAHRFLYLYPERLAAAGIGAPGRPTLLDKDKAWPAGVQDVEAIFGRPIDKDAIRKVPIHLVVGGDDSEIHGGKEFWTWLRSIKAKAKAAAEAEAAEKRGTQEQDGASTSAQTAQPAALPLSFGSRLESVQELHRLWNEDGIDSTLQVVDGFAHDNKALRPHILAFIKSRLEEDARA